MQIYNFDNFDIFAESLNAGLDCSNCEECVINRVENPTVSIHTNEVHQQHVDWDAYTSLEWVGASAIPTTKNISIWFWEPAYFG